MARLICTNEESSCCGEVCINTWRGQGYSCKELLCEDCVRQFTKKKKESSNSGVSNE